MNTLAAVFPSTVTTLPLLIVTVSPAMVFTLLPARVTLFVKVTWPLLPPANSLMAVFASMMVGRTDRGDAMFMAMANRSAQMAADLDAPSHIRAR